jgi:hypothetical protein
MLTEQNGKDMSVDQSQLKKTACMSLGDREAANASAISQWFKENPRQGPWSTVARMNGASAEVREPKWML